MKRAAPYQVFLARPEQERILNIIDYSKDIIILEAPTGFGKSFLAARITNQLDAKRTFVLTGTKQLQYQYLDVSGHSRIGVSTGDRAKLKFMRKDRYSERSRYRLVVTNYQMFARAPQFCDLMIIDEADQIVRLDWYFRWCRRLVLMSATILDPIIFLADKHLDVDSSRICFVPSDEFPIDYRFRPVFFRPYEYVSYASGRFDNIARGVVELLSELGRLRGVVHTVNYRLTMELARRIVNRFGSELLIHDETVDRFSLFEMFRNWHGRVLVSPSALRGLDLPGDKGRFAIFVKVPFPEITAKAPSSVSDRDWYYWQTACALIQGAGRCNRYLHDWSLTYILDGNYDWFYRTAKAFFPVWWHKANN